MASSQEREIPLSYKGGLYLRFDYRKQYEINLTSNLYRPYVIIHSRYLKSLADKLLFSMSYMIDYILKFHPHGFSWRNLEMIPDIILTNKDPNLRLFMQEMLQFLSRVHIREMVNGMFEFRFYSKISNEIKLLSKISEPGAAAFNFTLDESQQIKHYYRAKLHELRKIHTPSADDADEPKDFIYSISFLHNILGDLHYYDKEYDQAIIHYMDSIQPIRERVWANKQLSSHQLTHLVRTLLKHGMASSKIHASDSTFAIYRQLQMDLPRMFEKSRLYPAEASDGDSKEDFPLRRMQLYIRPYIFMLELIEKKRVDGITFYNLQSNLRDVCHILNTSKPSHKWLFQGTHFKLPRASYSGINHTRINTLFADYFYNVGNILFFKNQNFTEAYDGFRKKFEDTNRMVQKELRDDDLKKFVYERWKIENGDTQHFDYFPSLTAYFYYRQAINEIVQSFAKDLEDFSTPTKTKKWKNLSDISKAIYLLYSENAMLSNASQLNMLAGLFSSLGDAILTTAGPGNQTITDKLLELYNCSELAKDGSKKVVELLGEMTETEGFPFKNPLVSALVCYRAAGLFFYKSNRIFSYGFQYKKFMFVLKDWLEHANSRIKKEGISDEEKILFKGIMPMLIGPEVLRPNVRTDVASRLLHAITWEVDTANRPQILKYRQIIDGRTANSANTRDIYHNISSSMESRELIILVEEIRMKLYKMGVVDSIPSVSYLSPYDSNAHMFVRVQELRLQCEWHFLQINALLKDKNIPDFLVTDYFKKEGLQHWNRDVDDIPIWEPWKALDEETRQTIKYHIFDALFCLHEVIRVLNLYGLNHITNHSLLGSTHSKLANWCRGFFNFQRLEARRIFEPQRSDDEAEQWQEKLYTELRQLVNIDALYSLEPNYHDEQALEHYHHAIQTHKGGRNYRHFFEQMSFLEDDFNDNMMHFTAATERYRINSGGVRSAINKIKQRVDASKIYKYESYMR